jgi:biotin---protein ligase
MHNASLAPGQKPLEPVSQERLLGVILATFEQLWNKFVQTGTFSDFTGLYSDIWLHSNQEVTLVDTEPPTKAKIVGISSDYGMLRAVPAGSTVSSGDAEAWGKSATSREPFIDLQPDGNSFDMLQNLIRRKE